jgi:hypothetical protein
MWKNIAIDEQDKTNTEPTAAETVHADPAHPADSTFEKEAEAAAPAEANVEKEAEAESATPSIEVTEVTAQRGVQATKGRRVRI